MALESNMRSIEMNEESASRTAWVASGLVAMVIASWVLWPGVPARMTGFADDSDGGRVIPGIYRSVQQSEVNVSLAVGPCGRTVLTAAVSGNSDDAGSPQSFSAVLADLGTVEEGRFSGSDDFYHIAGRFDRPGEVTGHVWRADPADGGALTLLGKWTARHIDGESR